MTATTTTTAPPAAPPAAEPKRRYCATCADYLNGRQDLLAHHIEATANAYGVAPRPLAIRYYASVHRRHLAGLPLTVAVAGGDA